jgi:MYXO-CTERM domain-containing protein
MARSLIAVVLGLVLWLASPSIVSATTLISEGGFTFDIQDGTDGAWSTDGSMSDGLSDAYDGCYYLEVNGSRYTGAPGATTSLSGRQIELPEVLVGGLRARRLVYVPMRGGNWARYLEIVTNPGATAVTATIAITGNLGSDFGTMIIATSSGDRVVSTADAWAITDDMDGAGDPTLGHVFQGTDPPVRATEASISGDNIRWAWSVTIPPRGRVAIMHFAMMERNQAAARAEAARLVEAPDDALVGLDDYLDDIQNWGVSVPGAPRVRFEAPFEIREGDSATVRATIEDPEGDPTTWSWDLDGDGTFGEMPGATSYEIPAGTTDGPGRVRIGVEASDGRNTTRRYRTISVANVAPVILNAPGNLVASVGAVWRWQIEIEDPAGPFDPPSYRVLRGPSDMMITDGGEVRWVPDELDVTRGGEVVEVRIQVDDGDEGTAETMFALTVSPNHPPSEPTLLYPAGGIPIANPQPRLVVTSVEDPDGDVLTYYFEIDDEDTFDTPLHRSGGVAQTPGYSFWNLPAPLRPGRYHWRAWVSDGTVETEPRATSFLLVPDPRGQPDAGLGDHDAGTMGGVDAGTGGGGGGSRGGCAVSVAGGSRAAASLGLLVLVALAWVVRRRRGCA